MNIFLWRRWGGYSFGNDLVVCCLHYLTHTVHFPCVGCGKEKKVENISEPGKQS